MPRLGFTLFSRCRLAGYGLFLCLSAAVCQAEDAEIQSFANEEQRQLFYTLVEELRCPKCQNQNLAGSNSQIAIDLRNQVARLVRENQSEEQIKEYMVNRYGEFVLYEPPLNEGTWLLWFGPLIMAVIGVLIFIMSVLARKKNKETEADNPSLDSEGEA